MVEEDFDGDALNDFDEVSGGVFGREHAKSRAGALLEAVDVAVECFIGVGIDFDGDGLAGLHVAELGFLEVGGDIEVFGDDGEDDLALGEVVAFFDGAARHATIDGGNDRGVGEV